MKTLLFLLFAGIAAAQNPGVCSRVLNSPAPGQVLSATNASHTPPCQWTNNGGGGGSVSLTATGPIVITPSPTTGTGVISCPTCGTSATAAAGTWWQCVTQNSPCTVGGGDTWLASTAYFQSFTLPTSVTALKYISFKVGVAGSGNIAGAIFDSTCAKVANTDFNHTATDNAIVTVTLGSPPNLTPGQYFIGFAVESGSALLFGDPGPTQLLLRNGAVPMRFT